MRHKVKTELRWPGLWRGCVRKWGPLLGSTGLTLRDWSVFGGHGTLTNMDPSSDWVTSSGHYALDFDGTNDFATTTRNSALTISNDLTIEFWIVMRAQSQTVITIADYDHVANQGWTIQSEGATTTGKFYFVYHDGTTFRPIGGSAQGVAIPLGLSHVAYTKQGTTVIGYLNGLPVWTPTPAGAATITKSATREFRFGNVVDQNFSSRACNCQLLSLGIYQRALLSGEIGLLARRPGISYETTHRRRSSSAVQFNRRRRLLLGAQS